MKTKLILSSIICLALMMNANNANAQRKSGAKKTGQNPSRSTTSKSKSAKNKEDNEGKKLFTNIFWGGFVNGGLGPRICQYYTSTLYNSTTGTYSYAEVLDDPSEPDLFLNLLFIGLNERYMIKKIDDDHSLCVEASPSFGFGGSMNGVFNVEIPVSVSYNLGNAATYNTKKENGFGIGLGLQYLRNGIISSSASKNESIRSGYFEPILVATYRYLNANDYAREWSLKIGSGSVKPKDRLGLAGTAKGGDAANGFNPTLVAASTFSVRLSLGYYIGY
jgi:hypothetical protein